jgi:hypothetical protein
VKLQLQAHLRRDFAKPFTSSACSAASSSVQEVLLISLSMIQKVGLLLQYQADCCMTAN